MKGLRVFDTPSRKVGLDSNYFRWVECFKGFERFGSFSCFMGLTALDGIDSTLKIGFERFRCLEGLKRSGVSGDFDTPTKKVGLESNYFRCV